MAKMDETQESLISQLENARVTYDEFEAELNKEISERKWEAKENIRTLVREARKIGVPYRRIGFALKTSDHRTIQQYEKGEQ